jgi:hypothetical protein
VFDVWFIWSSKIEAFLGLEQGSFRVFKVRFFGSEIRFWGV